MADSFERPLVPTGLDLESNGVISIGEFVNSNNHRFEIYELGPESDMPESVAHWLRYRSLTEHAVKAAHEGDSIRFGDERTIRTKFLTDSGGRDLFLAVNSGTKSLDGVSWIHPLQNDLSDFLLADVVVDLYKKRDNPLPYDRFATLATREYGDAARSNLAVFLGAFAVDRYLSLNPNTEAIIARFGSHDNMTIEIHDYIDRLPGNQVFQTIDVGLGYVIMLATRVVKDEIPPTNNPQGSYE